MVARLLLPNERIRRHRLVVREFADELLVYDKERHEAHCLNRTAGLIWKYCDGRTSVAEISRRLALALRNEEAAIDEQVVWYALKQLKRDHLLQDKLEIRKMPGSINYGVNRRQAIRALGITAVVALPLVMSMVAPTPAQAVSCLGPGASCTASAQCCNGVCNAGTCA